MPPISKSRIFIGISLCFALGVFVQSWRPVPLFYVYGSIAVAAVALYFFYSSKHSSAALVALLFCFLGAGALRYSWPLAPSEYADVFESKQQWEGYIVEDVDERANYHMLAFQPDGYSQRVLLTVLKNKDYAYGDRVVVSGKVQQPQNFSDFDYQKYLERYNVYAVMRYPQVLILKSGQGNKLVSLLYSIKHWFIGRVGQELQEPQSSLAAGILIGARKTLRQDIVENFNLSGTSHIIAVSGFNITIIIGALLCLAPLLGRRQTSWVSFLVICGFVVIAGASASVLRAAAMGGLFLLSRAIGRQYSILPSLFFAGLVMVAINPKILFWDIGFQLSFVATLGIVCGVPVLEKLTSGWPKLEGLKSMVLVTISAMAATLPLILLHFGRLSLVAPLANILVLPVIGLTMLMGFLSVLPGIGHGFAFVASLLLSYIIRVTAYLAHVPYASLDLPISGAWFSLSISLLFLLYLWLKHKAGKVEPEAEVW